MARCPTCGAGVTVVSDEREGTSYYEPSVEHVLRGALQAMTTAGNGGAYADIYKEAGGGYEGLQAVARRALEIAANARGEADWPDKPATLIGPEHLSGDEGETVFIRRDLAETLTAARAYALEYIGSNLAGLEADEVEMLPVPAHFIGLDTEYEWATVHPGTPGAVRYWRFRA